MRILVTGSRQFEAYGVMRAALIATTRDKPGPHVLVHGDAPGSDRLAAEIATQLGWSIEPHPADWDRKCSNHCKHGPRPSRADGTHYCPAAGSRRNGLMVSLGADICLAFYKRGAKNIGTSDCVRRADRAHIPIERFVA